MCIKQWNQFVDQGLSSNRSTPTNRLNLAIISGLFALKPSNYRLFGQLKSRHNLACLLKHSIRFSLV
ncbi:MAG: hypothetical protein CL681_02025 [Blastopirellula sp.]|nr:hypothetical protein [Blastopirellula sp.]